MWNMRLRTSLPALALRDYVRYFQQREAHVTATTVIYPIPARSEQFLEFYLRDRYLVRSRKSGAIDSAARAMVVGPSTHRNVELVLRGRFEVFTIHFQASGFHQLFDFPMPELTDRAYEAKAVIGSIAAEMEAKLADALTFRERVDIAASILLRRVGGRNVPDAVARSANRAILDLGVLSIAQWAAAAGLGVRQFERKFLQQVGVTPRLYARIVRFQAALKAKLAAPSRSWTDIAHDLGFYDQMHMVHDFRRFSDEGPTSLMENFYSMPVPW
jgi:AraC-like DNA-binding protein